MKYQIKNRWNAEVIFEAELPAEFDSADDGLKSGAAVSLAVKSGANLTDANLANANLNDANLTGAALKRANLTNANQNRANLTDADLYNANLTGTELRRANLTGARLYGAILTGASLYGVNLTGARLYGVNLTGANLIPVNLNSFRHDLIAEILRLPNELEALREAIIGGEIDGSTYSTVGCSCLAGTLAKSCKIKHFEWFNGEDFEHGGLVFHSDSNSPREIWFSMISPGDTPDKSPAAKLALQWVDEAIAIRDNIRSTAA